MHAQNSTHAGRLDRPDFKGHAENAVCGDEVTIYLMLAETVTHAVFEIRGCFLCRASASLMADTLTGKSPDEVGALEKGVQLLLQGQDPGVDLGDLVEFSPVMAMSARHGCVLLPWKALVTPVGLYPLLGTDSDEV